MERYNSILSEAVQRPNNYLKLIQDQILKNKKLILKQSNNKINKLLILLSLILKKFKIKFYYKNEISKYFGIYEAETLLDKKNTIIIWCNLSILEIIKNEKIFDRFLYSLLEILGHEIVHRMQLKDIKDKKILNILSTKDINNRIQYFSNKQEIMAFAWQIIEQFRFIGYSDDKIKEIMKTYKNPKLIHKKLPEIYKLYIYLFNNDNSVLNKLHKYMYEYLQ